MNRREMLTGIVAAALAAAVPAVEATVTWIELHDGSPFYLGAGDFTVEMWMRRADQKGFVVDSVLVKSNSEEARKMLESHGLTIEDAYDIVRSTAERHERLIPEDGNWHHLHVSRGRIVLVDGTEHA